MPGGKATDKGLLSKIYKELLKIKVKGTINPVKKWAEDLNRTASRQVCRWQVFKKMLHILCRLEKAT